MRGEFIGQTKFGRSITSQSPERLSISTVHQFSEILPCLAATPKTCCCVEGRESVFESLGVEHGQSEFRHWLSNSSFLLSFCYPNSPNSGDFEQPANQTGNKPGIP
jgi:hypothetical protein